MSSASAPAKLILCGEHAVVYRRPAIAVPLAEVRAEAHVDPAPPGRGLVFTAPDLGRSWLAGEVADDPFSALALGLCRRLGIGPDLDIRLVSAIPIAGGMGSGAAIATALARALAAHAGATLTADEVTELVYESERHFHGTPSGIDNAVVAHEQAIWFQRREDGPPLIEPVAVGAPLTLVVGDTGVRSPTRLPVAAVRERWQADPAAYETLFDGVGAVARGARAALASGEARELGRLLDVNQDLLEQIGVSSPELNLLIAEARVRGALGAKLSGAGWGGVMLALVEPDQAEHVAEGLLAAGATRTLITRVG